MRKQIKLITMCLIVACCAIIADAQTTTFTYQGRLTDSSAAANGTYDLEFKLYDAGGNQIGAAQVKEDAAVASGVFTVQLDAALFAANAFDGSARFLEIAVRRGTETGAFTTLAPRQSVTSTPYAIRALNAGTADTATNATTADTATDAQQLGGVAAANYLQQNGSGANLTNLNASSIASGTLNDAQLSSNVALRSSANTFAGDQTINGNLTQTGTTTDLNLTNGFVTRGTFGTGAIPAMGAGVRMMFYPGKAAFRAGRVDGTQWDDANIGAGSVAFNSNNRASGLNSAAFGLNSTALGERTFALSGTASATGAIAMGAGAQATYDDALALGPSSISSGLASIAIGPSIASGNFSTAIGLQNKAKGNFSTVLGKNASDCPDRDCIGTSFSDVVSISDACATFSSDRVLATANNQVNIRGCGGVSFFTSQNLSSGVQLASGGGAWSSLSDRDMKENFRAVNSRDILQRVLKLPISTWNYKSQAASVRHIGAMAQDFKAAFAVGESDKMIATIDPDGVAFAAIQGLNEEFNEQTKKLKAENALLQSRVAAQAAQLDQFEARLKRLEQRSAKPRQTNKRKK